MYSSVSTRISHPWSARSNAEVGEPRRGPRAQEVLGYRVADTPRRERETALSRPQARHMPRTACCGRGWRLSVRAAADARAAHGADRFRRNQPHRWVSGGGGPPPPGGGGPPPPQERSGGSVTPPPAGVRCYLHAACERRGKRPCDRACFTSSFRHAWRPESGRERTLMSTSKEVPCHSSKPALAASTWFVTSQDSIVRQTKHCTPTPTCSASLRSTCSISSSTRSWLRTRSFSRGAPSIPNPVCRVGPPELGSRRVCDLQSKRGSPQRLRLTPQPEQHVRSRSRWEAGRQGVVETCCTA